jgi:alpha,alpha-trehalose phosphorylase
MAGTWLGIAYGFAGMRVKNGRPSFAPVLPQQWQDYQFHVHFQGQLLQVQVKPETVEYRLLKGTSLALQHRGQLLTLTTEQASICMALHGKELDHA